MCIVIHFWFQNATSQTLVCHNVLCHVTREVAFREDWALDLGNCDLGNLHLVLLSLDPTALMTWR